ncbi:Growth_factor receptor cysteine-rich domain superfamily [Hexamita inflata]|uniref:Growth_factor receptor cysteine-rich domain superfamily n=1 Tax=Hexamita inflata TaxID=28002 RepID=A0ABP1H686_9EUKA
MNINKKLRIENSIIQYRFQSEQSSGLVHLIEDTINECIMTNTNILGYEMWNNGGYLIYKLLVPLVLSTSQVQICSSQTDVVINQYNLINSGASQIQCTNICGSGEYYVYGLCLSNLTNGVLQINQTIVCVIPFEYNQNYCVCQNGYILNLSYCVPIVQQLTNLDDQIHNNVSLLNVQLDAQKSYLENSLIGNFTTMDSNLIRNTSYILSEMINRYNQLDQNLLDNTSKLDIRINDNISLVANRLENYFSISEHNLKQNTSYLEQQINYTEQRLDNQLLQNATNLNTKFTLITNNIISNISSVNNTLTSTTQLLRSDLIASNNSLNNLYTLEAAHILNLQNQVNVANGNIYNINNTATVLRNDLQTVNSTITGITNSLRTDLTSTQSILSTFKNDAITNNTNQQTDIDRIYANITLMKLVDVGLRNDLTNVNNNLLGITVSLKTDISSVNSTLLNLKSETALNHSNQQTTINGLQSTISSINSFNTQIRTDLTTVNQSLTSTTNQLIVDLTNLDTSYDVYVASTNNILNTHDIQITRLNSNVTGIISAAALLRTDLTSVNSTLIGITGGLRTDLTATNGVLHQLRTDTQLNHSTQNVAISGVQSSVTSLTSSLNTLRSDLTTVNSSLSTSLSSISSSVSSLQSQYSSFVSQTNANASAQQNLISFALNNDSVIQYTAIENRNHLNTVIYDLKTETDKIQPTLSQLNIQPLKLQIQQNHSTQQFQIAQNIIDVNSINLTDIKNQLTLIKTQINNDINTETTQRINGDHQNQAKLDNIRTQDIQDDLLLTQLILTMKKIKCDVITDVFCSSGRTWQWNAATETCECTLLK